MVPMTLSTPLPLAAGEPACTLLADRDPQRGAACN